jgi:hypothetical protein
MKNPVSFVFRRPGDTPKKPPSRAMTEALRLLSQSDEMKPFVANARAQRRKIVIELFHSSEGHPLLIHTATAPKQRA